MSPVYVVHKFVFAETVIDLPAGEILSVQAQYPAAVFPTVWLRREVVDGKLDDTIRQVVQIVGTGQTFQLDHDEEFVATAVCANGGLVFHAYSRPLPSSTPSDQ